MCQFVSHRILTMLFTPGELGDDRISTEVSNRAQIGALGRTALDFDRNDERIFPAIGANGIRHAHASLHAAPTDINTNAQGRRRMLYRLSRWQLEREDGLPMGSAADHATLNPCPYDTRVVW